VLPFLSQLPGWLILRIRVLCLGHDSLTFFNHFMDLSTIAWVGMVFVREKTEERGEPLSDGMER
jgi:hypothetical protein